MWRETLEGKIILNRNGTSIKLMTEVLPISLAVKNFPEQGAGSSYALSSARPPAFAGEYDLTTLASVREAALSSGGRRSAVPESIPEVKKPTDRIPRLNRTDKVDSCLLTRDSKNPRLALT